MQFEALFYRMKVSSYSKVRYDKASLSESQYRSGGRGKSRKPAKAALAPEKRIGRVGGESPPGVIRFPYFRRRRETVSISLASSP